MTTRRSINSLFVVMTFCCVGLSADPPTGTRAGQTRDDNSLSTALVWIPPGTFTMGSPKEEAGRPERENHVSVTLTQGFWLGKHEITQLEWTTVMHTTPWRGMEHVKEGDDYAASFINWDDAMKFCERLTETERRAGRLSAGWKYTLPTEAQWEYACRAGTTTRFSFGDDEANLFEYGWFDKNTAQVGQRFAHQVGKKKPNAWGLHDMHGNVYEWCRDRFAEKLPGGIDPQGPPEGTPRVDRGGGWEDPESKAGSASRDHSPPDERNNDLGFRLALVPSGQ